MSPPHDNHHVRRVVLPSGKEIDVVYFGAAGGASPVTEGLHVCERCSSQLVYPTAWHEASPAHWEISLRCPNCELRTTGVYPQPLVERFDDELDRGTDALAGDLRRLAHANMEAEIERFASALEGDHILPDDF